MNGVFLYSNLFWADETFTVRISGLGIGEIIKQTALDVHPPLYYFIVHFFTGILGNAPIIYRIISLIPYAVILIFSLTIVYKKWRKWSKSNFCNACISYER